MKKIIGIAILLALLVLPALPVPDADDVITGRSTLLSLIGETGSEQVICGKEGFLFFTESLEQALQPFSEEEIRHLTDGLTALRDDLSADGRRLLVLIAPDKGSVYPEMLPQRWRTALQGRESLCDQLAKAGIETVDALPELLKEKEKGLPYFKGDTHWNARGALAVYRLLAGQMELENAAAYPEMRFLPGPAGDLIRLCRPAASSTEANAVPDLERSYRTVRPFANLDAMKIETACGTNDRAVLVIRDSFGKGLFPYLAENVGRMTYSRSYTDIPAQAAAAGADTVLLEIVERDAKKLIEYLEE